MVALFERRRVLQAANAIDNFRDSQLDDDAADADELLVTATWESRESYGTGWRARCARRPGTSSSRSSPRCPEPRLYDVVLGVP